MLINVTFTNLQLPVALKKLCHFGARVALMNDCEGGWIEIHKTFSKTEFSSFTSNLSEAIGTW